MVQSASRSGNYNDHLNVDGSHQHDRQRYLGDLPFPGFITKIDSSIEDSTPVAKLSCVPVLKCDNSTKSIKESSSSASTKTPPVEASVSPEIQCGLFNSVVVSGATPSTCYGAGHVVSGVTDKRKCRPRGILSVGRINSFDRDSTEDDIHYNNNGKNASEDFTKRRQSLIPLPVEASISWNLSPFHEDEDYNNDKLVKGDYPKRLYQPQKSVGPSKYHSPPSPCGSNCSTFSNPEFQGFLEPSSEKVVGSSPISPCGTPVSKAVASEEERTSGYNFSGECSPFSVDSLSSENVMQTPESDSSSKRHHSLSWLNKRVHLKHQYESELDLVTNVLQQESLSPKNHVAPWDPLGLSAEFADLSSHSDFIDLNHLRENSDSRASSICDSTLENVSEHLMKISWRDGLISSKFDIDDLDCCRFLSDEENDIDGLNSNRDNQSAAPLTHNFSVELQNKIFSDNTLKSPKFVEQEAGVDWNVKEYSSPSQVNPCAESISTDGGGLIASGDSDWTVYYKSVI